MSLRPHPTKPGHWQIRISQGRNSKQLTFPPFQGNRAEAELYHAELKRAYRPTVTDTTSRDLTELLPDFLAYYTTVSAPSTVASWIRSWKNLAPVFGKIRPNMISMTIIQHYKQLRLSHSSGRKGGTVSKRTINKEISYLAAFIRWCESDESGPIIDPLPFRIKAFPGRQTRSPLPKILTEEEIDKLLAAMPTSSRGLAACLYYAGLRFSEAANLQRHHVDLARGILYIRGKGDKERIVPILPQLRPYLKGEGDGYLFISPATGEPYRDISTTLEDAARRVGITKHVYPHLLRHCFGAHGIRNISLRALQIIMGHSTPVVTQRYTQMAEQALTEEMATFRQYRQTVGN